MFVILAYDLEVRFITSRPHPTMWYNSDINPGDGTGDSWFDQFRIMDGTDIDFKYNDWGEDLKWK